ncbi:MAG: nucleotide exchange factor GrpE [Desulfobacteraceae bacterium]
MITHISNRIKKVGKGFDTRVTLPFMQWMVDILNSRIEKKSEKEFSRSEFKQKALADFKTWLADTDLDLPSATDVTPDTCDLFSLFSEFTALRQEIRMQNREQHRTLKRLESYTDTYQNNSRLFEKSVEAIDRLESRIWNNCEKKSAAGFFDVRDALIRGHKACTDLSRKRSLFKPKKEDVKNLAKGYEMALRRFDRSLGAMDIYPVKTDNTVFDPRTMKAVETKKVDGTGKGEVVETISCGFVKENTVLKFAEVIVAE